MRTFLIYSIGYTILSIIMAKKTKRRKKRIVSLRENHIPYSKYRIEWYDIASDSGWATESEFDKMKLATPISEGWLYEKDKYVVKIFSSYDKDDEGIVFGERTVIPVSCIKKMKKLH
jgi:hypothetical protein